MKAIFRPLWRWYIRWSLRHPGLAMPMNETLAGYGPVKVHPNYFRHRWDLDPDLVFQTMTDIVRPGDVIFDIGANIGQTSLVASKLSGPTGRVVAFEPSPPNAAMLRYHLDRNKIRNVTVEMTCVGNAVGTTPLSLLQDGLNSSNSITFSRKAEVPYVTGQFTTKHFPITTVDAYATAKGLFPKVLKIDVEGAEFDVLKGARETIQRCRPILLIGIHPFWWPDEQGSDEITRLLKSMNYETKTLRGELALPESYGDFLCCPQELASA